MRTIKFIVAFVFLNFCASNTLFAQTAADIQPINVNNAFNDDAIRHINNDFDDVVARPLGPVNIKATAADQIQYDTNIFWTPNDKKSDLIDVASPAIQLNMPLGVDQRGLVQLMYKADIGTFSNYKSQNYINQYAAFNSNYRLSFGYINVQDDFDHTVDRASTEFTNEVQRTDNDASVAVGVKFNKLTMETGYTDELRTFQDDLFTPFNHTEDMVSETALYQIFPKTQALVEYNHGFINYGKDSARSGDYDEELVGLKGNITGKTQGIVKVGYQDRTYNNSNGFSGFVADMGTVTQFSPRTKLSLTYEEGAQESTYLNNNFYNMHYFYATLDQKLKSRWSLQLTGGIIRNIYPEVDPTLFQKRQDSILVAGTSLIYTFNQWASANIGYTFREDMSNIKSQSYNDHLWTVGFELKF